MDTGKKGVLASFLRLIAHTGTFLAGEYWYFVRRSTWFCFIGVVAGLALVAFGAGRESGSVLVPLGTFVFGISFVVWLTTVILIMLAVQTAGQKIPLLGMNLKAIGILLFVVAFTVFYFAVSGIYAYPRFLMVGLGLLGLVMLSMVLGEGPKNLRTINIRVGMVFTGLTLVLLYLHLPSQYQSRIFFGSRAAGGLTPNKVEYTLEGLRRGQPAFFQSVLNSEGKVEPAIWYYFDKKEDVYYLFDKEGRYSKNGDALLPATPVLQDTIIEHDQSKKEQELKARQANDAADTKAEAERKADQAAATDTKTEADEAKQKATEVERVQKAAEDERQRQIEQARLVADREELRRAIASHPLQFTARTLPPNSQYPDANAVILARPTTSIQYDVDTLMNPEQTLIVIRVTNIGPGPDRDSFNLAIQPDLILYAGRRYSVGDRSVSQFLPVPKSTDKVLKELRILRAQPISEYGAVTSKFVLPLKYSLQFTIKPAP